jgi:hypothetical protein
MRAIHAAKQLFEFIMRDRFLKLGQRFPVWRVRERIAEMIGGPGGGKADEEEEEEEEGEEEGEEEPRAAKAKDHGLDFRLFNTMLARC